MCVGGAEKMGNERVYGAVYLRAQKPVSYTHLTLPTT